MALVEVVARSAVLFVRWNRLQQTVTASPVPESQETP